MINVLISYDPREAAALSVLAGSIQARASQPVSNTVIMPGQLKKVLTRVRHPP